METQIILSVLGGIVLLIFLILRVKLQAFLALLVTCLVVGLASGMPMDSVIDSIKNGMGGTLGFVATVVGLGAIFGALLEYSGSASLLATRMLSRVGIDRAPWAVLGTGFLIAIPVFFDVAFIILIPFLYALQQQSKKSLLLYALPLLAGLAITHSFIPPTPGPIAVADILGANLGWVIIMGFITGIPTAIFAGPVFANYISNKIFLASPPDFVEPDRTLQDKVSLRTVLSLIGLPIVLIVTNTLVSSPLVESWNIPKLIRDGLSFVGHPFSALVIANLLAWYFLGIRLGVPSTTLSEITSKSLLPAGTIILLTGAGGAFKQILIDTGAGKIIAETIQQAMPTVVFAFLVAAVVRLLQGSATVAMITSAGITAPLLTGIAIDPAHKAILVIAIASGASIFSHVNDSGFWLVKQYLGMTEKQTFATWSVLTTIIALIGLLCSVVLWYIL